MSRGTKCPFRGGWLSCCGVTSGLGYFRPLRAAQIQALFELSHGRYFLAFKGFHVAVVATVFALFVLVLDVSALMRVAALVFALTVLTGLHTFRGTVWEAYPVNHSLEVVAFCLLATSLTTPRSRVGRETVVSYATRYREWRREGGDPTAGELTFAQLVMYGRQRETEAAPHMD